MAMRNLLIIFFILSIQVCKAQNKITNIQPKNGDILFEGLITFNWNDSFLKDSSRKYLVEIFYDSTLTTVVQSSSLIDSTSFTTNLLPGKYYFKIKLFDSSLIITSSKRLHFIYSEIINLNNLSVFLRADSGVFKANGNNVYRWSNWADTSLSAVQPNVINQPTLVKNIPELNSLDAIRFDGSDDVMKILSTIRIADLRAVVRWGVQAQYFTRGCGLVTGGAGETWILKPIFSFTTTLFQANSSFSNITINNIQTADFSPLRKFKTIKNNGSNGVNFTNLLIGNDRELLTRNWNGDIAEIIGFSKPVSDSVNKIVDSYLCKKYGKDLFLGEDILANQGLCDTLFSLVDTSYSSYLWSNGDTTYSSNLTPGANYSLTVTNEFGCKFTDEISVVLPILAPEDQLLCLGDTFIYNTALSPTNYSFLWNDFSLDSFITITAPGDYYVTIIDSNSCSYSSDTLSVRYDSSLLNFTLGMDTAVCRGDKILIVKAPPLITSYLWSTGNRFPTQLIDSNGIYTLQISNGKCFAVDTINVSIKGKAPVANFEFQNLCFGDSLSFVDSSKVAVINDTIINWNWHFGNGDSQVLQNPRYRYAQRGKYNVFLEIETDKGCFDTISKFVEINPLPIVNFNFQQYIVCAKSRIFHQDSSFISGGLISDYDWNFGDILSNQNTSTAKNPFHTFDTVGNYNILLKVTSNLGCFDSVQKTLFVNSTPIPNYTIDGFCIGDSITLSEQVVYAGLDSIEYFWTIRLLGGNFTTDRRMNPKLKFTNSGDYDIDLRARKTIGTFEWCEANFNDTITLFDSPTADFTIPEICENDSFEISNSSMPIADILKYRYILNQTDTFNLPNPKISGKLPGKYPLSLLISDANSCKDSIVKQLEISQKPKVQFSILNNNSGVPFNIDLDNRSLSSSSYLWKFGTGDTSLDEEPNYVYSDTGTFQITLIGSTSSGCIDSTSQNAFALSKFIDASLTKLFLTENTLGDIEVSFQILNSGFNTINNLLMSVDLNNEFEFRELFLTNLYSGRSDGFKMDATFIPNAGRKLDYVCVRIFAVNGESDSIVLNNELCELGFNDELSITLYPNPVEDLLNFQYTLPNDGVAQIQFFDALGRERKNGFSKRQEEGFYSTVFNLVDFTRGIYYYRFIFNGNVKTGKFMAR